jgi:glycosyltransferase involved in cell wall biosynthesis
MKQVSPATKVPVETGTMTTELGPPRGGRDGCPPPAIAERHFAATRSPFSGAELAVIIPCYNEAKTIRRVVEDFRHYLPRAAIYVFDNDSTDTTAAEAEAAGAVVIREGRRGKGNVVRRMFAEVEAHAYVMVDGDGTYEAAAAPNMVARLLIDRLDMVVGVRLGSGGRGSFRQGHRLGNRVFTALVRLLFGRAFADILSGYRVLSRRFVKSFPATSSGFEIETELSIHSLQLKLPTTECETLYFPRPADSPSKLKTYRDGFRIFGLILYLVRDVRPMLFFGALSLFLLIIALVLGYPVVKTYYEIGLVPRLPTAILATGLVLLASLSFTCGVILDGVVNGRIEQKRLAHLAQSQRDVLVKKTDGCDGRGCSDSFRGR